MRSRIPLVTVVLLLCATVASAQGILPRSFHGWSGGTLSQLSAVPSGNKATATNATEEEAAAQREYGFVSAESEQYTHGATSLQVSVYKMTDPSGAYGLYTYLRTADMGRVNLTKHSLISRNRALILVGNLLLDVRGKNLRQHTKDLKELIAGVLPHANHGAYPTLWENLPAKNFVPGTDRYILGPQILNQFFPVPLGESMEFSQGAEAEVGRYRIDGENATLLLVDFPTPQIASATLAKLKKTYDVSGSKPAAGTPPLYAKRALTMLAIVAGPRTAAQAKTLLGRVHSNEVVTWNAPAIGLTQPSFATMVVGVFVGTGVLCLFAMVASLAFGGFRLMVKRALPGRIFDRAQGLQVLQLGLSGKPIRAEDFYDRSGPPVEKLKGDKNLPDRVALRIFR